MTSTPEFMQMEPFDIKAAWQVNELQQDDSWIHTLNQQDHGELLSALEHYKNRVATEETLRQISQGTLLPNKDNFPLPVLGSFLKQVQSDLEESRGLVLIKNFPLQANVIDNRLMFGGLISHVGTTRPQTVNRELLQEVHDEGQASLDERRGSKHNLGLPIHNDPSDVVGFLCTRIPLSGGETILVSAAAVHNAMLRDHPEALQRLYQPYEHAWQDYLFPGWQNSAATGLPRTWSAPIFSHRDGKMCCRYSRFYTDRAQTYEGVQAMSKEQVAALDIFDSYLYDEKNWQYRRQFNRGDVMLVNNHVVFHSRTAYVNGDTLESQRHLYRAWLNPPNSRPLDNSLGCFFGNTDAGSPRGGVKQEFRVA